METSGFYFVQMSDAHVMGEADREIYGVRPAHNLRAAVQYINALSPPPDFCIHTGDSVSEESEKAYRLFREELALLRIPIHFAIGNHDNRESFRRFVLTDSFPGDAPYYYDFELHGWHIIILDSSEPGKISGRIDNAQLQWLARTLQHSTQPAFVFLHHPPLPLGIPWLDDLMLQDPTPLMEVLRRAAPRVRWVFFGHVHHECHVSIDGLHFTSVPALSFQFSETAGTERFTSLPPGVRLVHVQGEMIRTLVHRLT